MVWKKQQNVLTNFWIFLGKKLTTIELYLAVRFMDRFSLSRTHLAVGDYDKNSTYA